jgi:two-component system phosphate regulon sensor histidine kinase PhoR
VLWPIWIILALAALMFLHWGWRRRFRRAQEDLSREIEKLKNAQKQAAVQFQTQQDALLNSMAEGLLLLDETGRIQLANQAFLTLFGVSGDIRSRTIMEALRLHELAELVNSLSAEKRVLGHELRVSRPNERWLEVNGAAIFTPDDQRHGTILVFHDLTRLKQLESARKDFVANVSHELRTPLSLIKGYVETLLDGAKDNPEVADKFLLTIERNAERLKLLIEDLLTISELESGRIKLDVQPVALAPLVEKAIEDFKRQAGARGMSLAGRVPELVLEADAGRLQQVLSNLIDNAIKYGKQEGNITVGARAAERGWAEIFVQDDGPGIPAEAIERVFERFYRVDKARSREQGGTGLGLSIVKHIVQSHGGRVWARSEPGKGATFFLTLPQVNGIRQPSLL